MLVVQGCLRPVDIKIPEGSILWPSAEAAVVGGNVQTSQRVTDVILKCFNAAAASQGGCIVPDSMGPGGTLSKLYTNRTS